MTTGSLLAKKIAHPRQRFRCLDSDLIYNNLDKAHAYATHSQCL